MKRIPLLFLILFLLSLITAVVVYAQDNDSSATSENGSSISIVETIPVTASVEVNVNGQFYKLAIPVTVNIDATQALSNALQTAQAVDRVGIVEWRITSITEYADKFTIAQSRDFQPSSPENKLVVIDSQVTNLDTVPYSYYADGGDRLAYDELGNLYVADTSARACDDINPGATASCLFVFDVPKTATIVGLDLKVIDHKRIPFAAQE